VAALDAVVAAAAEEGGDFGRDECILPATGAKAKAWCLLIHAEASLSLNTACHVIHIDCHINNISYHVNSVDCHH